MHTEVLGWDLYQVLNDDSMYSLRKVPVHFDSVDEYLDVMEPLLLEESRAQQAEEARSLGPARQSAPSTDRTRRRPDATRIGKRNGSTWANHACGLAE